MSKEAYLQTFRQEREAWNKLLLEVGEPRMEQPGLTELWSFRDLVTHLTGWRKRTVARIRAGCGNEIAEPTPWPAEMGSEEAGDADTDRINEYIFETGRSQNLREVLDESEIVLNQLQNALEALPESAFDSPDCFAWLEGQPLSSISMFSHLHEDHEADIYRWLKAQQPKATSIEVY